MKRRALSAHIVITITLNQSYKKNGKAVLLWGYFGSNASHAVVW